MESGTTERSATEVRALQATTVCEAFQITAAESAERIALRTPGGAVELTFSQYAARVRDIAAGLHALGVRRHDNIGLMLVNRPEFNLCDCAVLHLGATPFSIYNTSSPEQIEYLFTNAGNSVVITETRFLDAIHTAGVDAIEHVVCVDGAPDGTTALGEIERAGSSDFDFEESWRAVEPDDVLTLIYTSGTTGPPKGVQLTHANLMAEARAVAQLLVPTASDRITSYLPHAHIADRFCAHYSAMLFGQQLTVIDDIRQVVAALPDVRPTIWGSVPRVWEKMKAALEAEIEREPDEGRRQAVRWAIDVGLRKVRAEQTGDPVPDELRAEYEQADELVLSKIREKVGLDHCRVAVVGAAPTPVEVLEFFAALGIPICDSWGMSELSCFATINPPDRIKIGTVGPPLPGVELKLADDGELLCRGPIVMKGYRNDPEKTAETIDPDGWLHTGDVAEIDADGYVRIVDRKKELIINAAGKNMSPANIEARLKASSPLIGQACCIGDGRPYNVALIVLDPDGAARYAAEHGLADGSLASVANEPTVRAEVERGVEEANSRLSRVEQIKRFAILPSDWVGGGDELTPTMKLKRRPIAEKYATEIEALYAP
jgi:long-chain acyl-CoA synthetase